MASPTPSHIVRKECDHEDSITPQDVGNGGSYYSNTKIMQVSIILLMGVVVLVILLHVYARWLVRRQARRRAALPSLGLVARANHSAEQPPKMGLDPSVIVSLPTFTFRQPDPTAQNEQTLTVPECAVCLSVLKDEEVIRLLPNCKHTFHVECIDKWFALHSTCPVCRAEAQPAARPELSGKPAGSVQMEPAPGSMISLCVEGASADGAGASSSHKRSGSISRLSSFQRVLSREKSPRRIQPQEDNTVDIERQ